MRDKGIDGCVASRENEFSSVLLDGIYLRHVVRLLIPRVKKLIDLREWKDVKWLDVKVVVGNLDRRTA